MIGNLFVQQNFTGFSEDTQDLNVDIKVEANLPSLHYEDQVIYPDFSQEFQYRSNQENPDTRKVIEYKGSVEYKLTNIHTPDEFRSFRIESSETVHFSVCLEENDEKLGQSTALTKLSSKKMFVTFSNSERLVRFTSSNFVKPVDDPTPNPCETNDCHTYAECVADVAADDGYFCHCKPGFSGDGRHCNDTNECAEETTHCSRFAECINLLGHYECKCLPPRVGDGRACELRDANGDVQDTDRDEDNDVCSRCDVNANCVFDENRGVRYCRCKPEYLGNGYTCRYGKTIYSSFKLKVFFFYLTMNHYKMSVMLILLKLQLKKQPPEPQSQSLSQVSSLSLMNTFSV